MTKAENPGQSDRRIKLWVKVDNGYDDRPDNDVYEDREKGDTPHGNGDCLGDHADGVFGQELVVRRPASICKGRGAHVLSQTSAVRVLKPPTGRWKQRSTLPDQRAWSSVAMMTGSCHVGAVDGQGGSVGKRLSATISLITLGEIHDRASERQVPSLGRWSKCGFCDEKRAIMILNKLFRDGVDKTISLYLPTRWHVGSRDGLLKRFRKD